MHPVYRLIYLLSLGIIASGCVTGVYRNGNIERPINAVELATTPFYPQSRYQCGPASLATILNATGLNIDPGQLAEEVYLPDRKGTLQIEMISAVRRYGLVPYNPGYDLQSIVDQLNYGLPVLVLLNLGFRVLPAYHYAVVIGYKPDSDLIIMRSGTDYRLLMPRQQFLSAWHKSHNWALTALPAGKLPAAIDIERYLKSIIALESVGQWRAAEMSYGAVLSKWPENTLARFGLANTLRAQGLLNEAVSQYGYALKLDVGHKPVRNNLADTLLQLGRCEEAYDTLEQVVISGDSTSAIDKAIRETRSEIQATCSRRHAIH